MGCWADNHDHDQVANDISLLRVNWFGYNLFVFTSKIKVAYIRELYRVNEIVLSVNRNGNWMVQVIGMIGEVIAV